MADTMQLPNRDKVAQGVSSAAHQAANTAGSLLDAAKDKVQGVANDAANVANQAAGKVEEWSSAAAGQARELGGAVADKAEDFGKEVNRLIRRHPFETLLLGVGVGFGLGLLIGRGTSR